ncbi:hypothetical protein PHYPSEUDO_013187 [Phytophthora pseudosyringae]|uniref:Uncharacterized protein n=1 Tax=Phytophthora pseudosyringae TaxID=221518 RepID=A0A8T1W5X4_9STRA|nr:hypothetical protein PHYPSEUDO_013187 [Phytophthora pseudosyringae]
MVQVNRDDCSSGYLPMSTYDAPIQKLYISRKLAPMADMHSLLNFYALHTMNSMNVRQQLMERGYVVLYKAVSDEFVNNIRSLARYDELSWSNGIWDGKAADTQ